MDVCGSIVNGTISRFILKQFHRRYCLGRPAGLPPSWTTWGREECELVDFDYIVNEVGRSMSPECFLVDEIGGTVYIANSIKAARHIESEHESVWNEWCIVSSDMNTCIACTSENVFGSLDRAVLRWAGQNEDIRESDRE